MQMTDEEIRRNYASAKNKKTQLGILADLNCCEKDEIKRIVEHVPKHEVKQDTVSHCRRLKDQLGLFKKFCLKSLMSWINRLRLLKLSIEICLLQLR